MTVGPKVFGFILYKTKKNYPQSINHNGKPVLVSMKAVGLQKIFEESSKYTFFNS